MSTFADLGVPADLVAVLRAQNILEPFDVQLATIPDALAGLDLCGRAPTGSGKTLAFGIPLAARTERTKPKRPKALVLAPTRELAAQILQVVQPLAAARGLRTLAVYGGVGYEPQRKALRQGVEILIACPGRLGDLIQQNALRLDGVQMVVIDEADRMADMGFLPDVSRLLDEMPRDRQVLLFSATLDGAVGKLSAKYQNDPVRHEVGSAEPDITSMDHQFHVMDPSSRPERTVDVVGEHGATLVFTKTRHGADRLAKQLERSGIRANAIHGGRTQGQRDKALKAFKDGRVQALVATDVAARGIHVDGVACVIHFDPPMDNATYVHRSGRTARAGATGTVVSFVAPDKQRESARMQRALGILESGPGDVERDARDARADGRPGGGGRSGRNRNRSGNRGRKAAASGGGHTNDGAAARRPAPRRNRDRRSTASSS